MGNEGLTGGVVVRHIPATCNNCNVVSAIQAADLCCMSYPSPHVSCLYSHCKRTNNEGKMPPHAPKKKQKVGVALTGPASPTFKKTNNKKNYILKVCNFCIFLKYFPYVFQDIFLKVKESVELPHSNELRVLPVF